MTDHVVLATPRHREALREAGVRGWWSRPGTWGRFAASFVEDGFASRGPLGGVDYRLPVLRDLRRRGDVVEVRLRPRGTVLVVAELFPVVEQERLTRALASRA